MLYKAIKTKQIKRLKIFFLLIFANVIYANNFNKIDILGNHPAKSNLLNKAKKFLNKDMNQNSVSQLYSELSNKLQDDGYITAKLNIVEGNINDGNIIFDIESGKIGKIYFYDKTFSPRMIKTAFDIKEGDEFNIKHLDQGIDNLNIGGKDYKLEIVDSDKKNYSDVIIYDNGYKYPNFINMTLDNSPGSPYTKLELATQKYNLLNLNDTLGVSINTKL
ncbi:hypothetical protein F1B92_07855 [Campylobacter sp. FMV-PI01]|uniref:ShlB/FhaC/HecB family hemolysin secretion/activation protein n=1 Tax=Campylobacter portucalensis TaxID=2608384 RepID=A0A6L5WML4_9BACT|nr:POTRA domain-containing protein [Campylobacter portucalensis]MSN97073.1 hypothetical protein [Campylobacter portucalensis]